MVRSVGEIIDRCIWATLGTSVWCIGVNMSLTLRFEVSVWHSYLRYVSSDVSGAGKTLPRYVACSPVRIGLWNSLIKDQHP